jgi:hypothetical protein
LLLDARQPGVQAVEPRLDALLDRLGLDLQSFLLGCRY